MTRLNRRIKDEIIAAAIAKSGVPARREKLKERRAAFAEDVRIHALGGADIAKKIDKAKKAIAKALEGIPDCVIKNGVFRSDYDILVNAAGARNRVYFSGACGYTSDSVYKYTPAEAVLEAGDPLIDEFHAIEREASDISEAVDNVTASVEGALSKVTTIKKLLEVWPECKELLPSDLSPVKNTLPAVRAEDLNALIGLPSGEGD